MVFLVKPNFVFFAHLIFSLATLWHHPLLFHAFEATYHTPIEVNAQFRLAFAQPLDLTIFTRWHRPGLIGSFCCCLRTAFCQRKLALGCQEAFPSDSNFS